MEERSVVRVGSEDSVVDTGVVVYVVSVDCIIPRGLVVRKELAHIRDASRASQGCDQR